jgi:hypothetical protein
VVWREQKISHVCLGVVSFPEVEHPRKNPTVGILLCSTVFSTESIARNSRCFEGLLLVFDSDYSGVCILVAHDHLPVAVLVLRVPEIAFQNEGVLPVVAQGP